MVDNLGSLEARSGAGTKILVAPVYTCAASGGSKTIVFNSTVANLADKDATAITLDNAYADNIGLPIGTPIDFITPGGFVRTAILAAEWDNTITELTVEKLDLPIPAGSTVSWPPLFTGTTSATITSNREVDTQNTIDSGGWQTSIPTTKNVEITVDAYYNPASAVGRIINNAGYSDSHPFVEVIAIAPVSGCEGAEKREVFQGLFITSPFNAGERSSSSPVMVNVVFNSTAPIEYELQSAPFS